jgi:hypothetical protein
MKTLFALLITFIIIVTPSIRSVNAASTWQFIMGGGTNTYGCRVAKSCTPDMGPCPTLNATVAYNRGACDAGPGEWIRCEYKCLF